MNYKRLGISLILPQLAGVFGSLFTASAVTTWYIGLDKPIFNPPNWIFGPVWVVLYLLMGISVYLVWQKIETKERARDAFFLFWVHLFINAIWSMVFFGLQDIALALVVIMIIWMLILILIQQFFLVDKRASLLLIPYLLWVTFATVLNFSLWRLN